MTTDRVAPASRGSAQAAPGQSTARAVLSKVPEATALFWVLKVLTTAMGEVLSDSLIGWFGDVAVVGGVVGLVAALVWQFRTRGFRTWPYWTAVAMVAVTGTMLADGLRNGLGLSYVTTTILFSVALVLSLSLWYASERTLSIHSITTRRREGFYWSTVMATFALGTAVGDMCASTLRWGFLPAALLFCGLIAVPALAHRFARLNAVVAFWWAYVLTRPLGASFADWAWVPHNAGGLALGKGNVALMLLPPFVALVAWAARTRDGDPKATPVTT
jgi:uncharacterized membrane-anchored protein